MYKCHMTIFESALIANVKNVAYGCFQMKKRQV